MGMLLRIEEYPNTAELFKALSEQFAQGADLVNMARDGQFLGSMLSPEATKKALARKVAEQWLDHPSILSDLASSLEEEPEDWD